MRASFLVQVLAFATAALAQTPGFDPFFSPLDQSKYKVGDVLPIAWNATKTGGRISLTLVGGTSAKGLAPVTVIAAHIDNTPGAPTTYAWPIPPNIGSFASYGVNLTLDGASDFQYSSQFYISGGVGAGFSSTTTITDTTVTQTTQTTSTITVANSTSSLATTTMSSNMTMTTASPTPSKTKTGAGTGTVSESSTPSPTKNAGEALRLGGMALVRLGGSVMAFLL